MPAPLSPRRRSWSRSRRSGLRNECVTACYVSAGHGDRGFGIARWDRARLRAALAQRGRARRPRHVVHPGCEANQSEASVSSIVVRAAPVIDAETIHSDRTLTFPGNSVWVHYASRAFKMPVSTRTLLSVSALSSVHRWTGSQVHRFRCMSRPRVGEARFSRLGEWDGNCVAKRWARIC
jgi:hypothetical protein